MKKITLSDLTIATLTLTACGNSGTSTQKTTTDAPAKTSGNTVEILNVSYDVARDFYKDYNPLFVESYKKSHPDISVNIKQSHGGSSKQALAVKNGLEADVGTMNPGSDVELLADSDLVSKDWRSALPNNAIPFTSTVVFLVRSGNPKGIKDWDDLAKSGTELVIANPKTTGNGRYAFLGAYGYGLHTFNKDEAKTHDLVKGILGNVKVFENGGRAATTTFAQRGIGDVLITFENEANVIKGKFGNVDIVYPSYTINAENPVAVVNAVTDKKGSTDVAKAYLEYLYSDEAQNLAVTYFLRPSNPEILKANQDKFPEMTTFFPNDVFGDWKSIMSTYFSEGGVYDKLAVGAKGEVAK